MNRATVLREEAKTWERLSVFVGQHDPARYFNAPPDLFTLPMRARWNAHLTGMLPWMQLSAGELQTALVLRCLLLAVECREEARGE